MPSIRQRFHLSPCSDFRSHFYLYTIQSARFSRCDVTDDPDLAKGVSAPLRILAALGHGALDLESICETLHDIPRATLEPALSRMVKSGKLTRPDRGTYGLSSNGKLA